MRWTACLLSLFAAGLGHLYLRYHRLGAVLLMGFLAGANGVFLSTWLAETVVSRVVFWLSVLLLGGVWTYALVHVWFLGGAIDRRLRSLRARRESGEEGSTEDEPRALPSGEGRRRER